MRSVAGMAERLETISRQMGLKFNHHNTTFYLSTETFYMEVTLDLQVTHLRLSQSNRLKFPEFQP